VIRAGCGIGVVDLRFVPSCYGDTDSTEIGVLEARARGDEGEWIAFVGLSYGSDGRIHVERYYLFDDDKILDAFATEEVENLIGMKGPMVQVGR